jgi:hypothetical protein
VDRYPKDEEEMKEVEEEEEEEEEMEEMEDEQEVNAQRLKPEWMHERIKGPMHTEVDMHPSIRRLSSGVTVAYAIVGLSSTEASTAQLSIADIISSPASFATSLTTAFEASGTTAPAGLVVAATAAKLTVVTTVIPVPTFVPTAAPMPTDSSNLLSKGASDGLNGSLFLMGVHAAVVLCVSIVIQLL